MRVGLYAGSFDPVTLGHEDIVTRALRVVDRLVVAVAVNSGKSPLFSLDERAEMLRAVVGSDRVEVRAFDGLLADLARDVGASVLVRGVRGVVDFDYETVMARHNRLLVPEAETVFLVPGGEVAHVSSTFVREIARNGGDVSALVRPMVAAALRARFAR
ncbi:Phosphopantetheine adenylyltransferase [Gemmatirosa kalamazoonensis]|uniref:Phosphopantetheine adenylyltransferase n=1 Tax=Gemmatirosa kalamazoonensis TaxID=861299 RepID=W0RIR2_9BACT|nr:pantetheine-phosphate adenylyltransferase [Gemmatirosa kalamazoonensis]AHG90994.1 Phosphopantetheine adenylyltransferase [Gemmatirosa kalamazoonensis]